MMTASFIHKAAENGVAHVRSRLANGHYRARNTP